MKKKKGADRGRLEKQREEEKGKRKQEKISKEVRKIWSKRRKERKRKEKSGFRIMPLHRSSIVNWPLQPWKQWDIPSNSKVYYVHTALAEVESSNSPTSISSICTNRKIPFEQQCTASVMFRSWGNPPQFHVSHKWPSWLNAPFDREAMEASRMLRFASRA